MTKVTFTIRYGSDVSGVRLLFRFVNGLIVKILQECEILTYRTHSDKMEHLCSIVYFRLK